MQYEEQKEEIKDQPITKEEDRKRIFKMIFETIFIMIIASLYWKILGRSIKEVVLISVASIIVIIYLNYRSQKRLEFSEYSKKIRRMHLKKFWMAILGSFLAILGLLHHNFFPESNLWIFIIIPGILILGTWWYQPKFLIKSK